MPQGGARDQNLVLSENRKNIGLGYLCLSGHFFVKKIQNLNLK